MDKTETANPIRITRIVQTCFACPSQWEGRTDDDRPIYVRYRWGYLSVSVGPVGGTVSDAIRGGEELCGEQLGGDYDGDMNFTELCEHTAGAIDWSAVITEAGRDE